MAIVGEGEPDSGSREELIKALLKEALRDPDRAPINSATHSATGLALSDHFTSKLEVLTLLRVPPLTSRGLTVLLLYYGPRDLTNDRTARALGVSRATVVRDKRAAIDALVRRIWCEEAGAGGSGPPMDRLA